MSRAEAEYKDRRRMLHSATPYFWVPILGTWVKTTTSVIIHFDPYDTCCLLVANKGFVKLKEKLRTSSAAQNVLEKRHKSRDEG